jgi:hypothetical protein
MATREFTGLAAFSAFLTELELSEPERLLATAGAAGLTIQHEIKEVFGDRDKLAALADSTITERERKGDGEPDRPLLIDGHLLRDSIEEEHVLTSPASAMTGVGSSEEILLYHEIGSGHYPPRPAFSIGVYAAMEKVTTIISTLLRPGLRLRNGAGRFASASDPDSFMRATLGGAKE